MIAQGRVRIGQAVLSTAAVLVAADDRVFVDDREILRAATAPRLYLYHKPAGLVTSHRDERGRPTVFSALAAQLPRVVSVGRLDLDSEGLLLLTTSGALARYLELPAQALARQYRVRAYGELSEAALRALGRGITIDGVHYRPMRITPQASAGSGRNRWYQVTIEEGKNREIRRVFAHFGVTVSRLIRTGYGPFSLGKLAPGAWQEVTQTAPAQALIRASATPATPAPSTERRSKAPAARKRTAARTRPKTAAAKVTPSPTATR